MLVQLDFQPVNGLLRHHVNVSVFDITPLQFGDIGEAQPGITTKQEHVAGVFQVLFVGCECQVGNCPDFFLRQIDYFLCVAVRAFEFGAECFMHVTGIITVCRRPPDKPTHKGKVLCDCRVLQSLFHQVGDKFLQFGIGQGVKRQKAVECLQPLL